MGTSGGRIGLCYYSATGNTRLAAEYLARESAYDIELIDVTMPGAVDLSPYSAVGFAAPTDFGGVPQRFLDFIASLRERVATPAFVLTTYGFMGQLALADLAQAVTSRGYVVIAGHSVRLPENYPPMIKIGLGGVKTLPAVKHVRAFDAFARELDGALAAALAGAPVPAVIRPRGFDALARPRARTTAREDMGEKLVDAGRCTECGTCAKGCPYGAILLDPKPAFDQTRCYGCWRCYNRCPQRAISTRRFDGTPFYGRPAQHAREVLGGR